MSNYPPYYHYRTMYEALSQYETYMNWAAQSSAYSRYLRHKGRMDDAAVYQRISAKEYAHARRYRNIYVNQRPLAELERRERDGR
jgi:hypothetical protein